MKEIDHLERQEVKEKRVEVEHYRKIFSGMTKWNAVGCGWKMFIAIKNVNKRKIKMMK